MTVEYGGNVYAVPGSEPPQDRSAESLHPIFRRQLEAYLTAAQSFSEHTLRMGECRRTLERQLWLYASGRTRPGPVLSKTLESRHRYGLACDLVAVNAEGAAVWESSFWARLYEDVSPEWFGLRHILPFEYVHLELQHADALIARAASLGVVAT